MDKLMTVQEAASYLNCHPITLRKLISERQVPFIKKKGLGIRLRESDLDKWLDSNSYPPEGWDLN